MEAGKPSRFRHTFGYVRSKCGYEAVKSRSTRDGSLIKANGSIVAVQWATTGFGALAVLPTRDGDKSGKSARLSNPPLIEAHKSSLQDFDISPFNERLIATSDGGAIKLWNVPEEGLTETIRESSGEVTGEAVKRLSALKFHPTSENLMTTCGKDFILRIFDIAHASPVIAFKESHSDIISSTSWSADGKLVATSCKDKQLRICDPRANTEVLKTEAHPGAKGFMASWLGQRDQIVSAGFNKNGERQLAIWDFRSFSTALHISPIDTSPGMITPYYDQATEMVFLLGRGDNTIRYYEVNDEEPYIHYLDQFRGTDSQSDITPFPKRLVDYTSCEIARFAKLTKDKIEHVMFQVPRKESKDTHIFHEDLYKYVPCAKPATTAQEWLKGATKEVTFLTVAEMMPSGYLSSYELDPGKKAEDEKREQEKRAYQAMSSEEIMTMKEAEAAKKHGGTSSDKEKNEEDSADDEAILARFASYGRLGSASSSSSVATSSQFATSVSLSSDVGTATKSSGSTVENSKSFIEGPKQGRQKVTLEDGSIYDGAWKDDQKHGTGIFTHKADGSIYEGSWMDDKRAGKGRFQAGSGSAAVTIDGLWLGNSLDTQHAVFTLADGSVFEFVTVNSSGQITDGKLIHKDGEVYEGSFSFTGKRQGYGIWRGKDGGKYEGEYKEDRRHGKGEYSYPDGGVYTGSWKFDLPDGSGEFQHKSGQVIVGTWAKGKLTTLNSS